MKLLIVESNGLFRDAFVRRFDREADIELVAQIDRLDPVELPAEVELLEPDIVLIGVGVADSDTLAAVNRVMAGQRHPGVILHGRSLTLPAAMRVTEILRSIDHGFAYLDSDRIQSVDGLVSIARVVAEGKVVIDPQTTQRLLGMISTHVQAMALLTADERQMLDMMARGETDDAIARTLGIDRSMVSAMVIDVASKFGVDGTSRDARVTTILRYLVGTGALPMDYDTGAVIQGPARIPREMQPPKQAPAQPEPPVESAEDREAEHEEPSEGQSGALAEDAAAGDGQSSGSVEAQGTSTESPSAVQTEERQAGRTRSSPQRPTSPNRDVSFHYGQEAVEEFAQFSQLGKPEDVEVAMRVLEWAASRGLRVRWGSRASGGSFALVLDVGNLSSWLLTVWAIGTVEVQFAMMMAQPPFNEMDRRRDLASRLNLVQGVRIDDKALSGRPRVPLASLRNDEDWDFFTGAMDWALNEIRAFFQPPQSE